VPPNIMDNKELVDRICQDIKKSKKYKSVYDKTMYRIVRDFSLKNNNQKIVEKKAKNLLHQIWGAFYATRPNFKKVLIRLETDIKSGKSAQESVLPILRLQSSVAERIPILSDFYKKIFEVTGVPNSVIDYACGLNPLTLFWMDLPASAKYQAFDIDQDQTDFLNEVFGILKVKNATVALGDVLCDQLEYADVVFLLKLLPCLEHQKKDAGMELLKKLSCKYIVVSFPVKSLGGKKAGMADFYRNHFKSMVEKEGWGIIEIWFDTELVFVIKK